MKLKPGECPVTKYGNYALIFGAFGYGVYKVINWAVSKPSKQKALPEDTKKQESSKEYVAEPSKYNGIEFRFSELRENEMIQIEKNPCRLLFLQCIYSVIVLMKIKICNLPRSDYAVRYINAKSKSKRVSKLFDILINIFIYMI